MHSDPYNYAAPVPRFQAAANATITRSEVDALNPAGYGPYVISQAVSIEGQGWSYIAPPPGGNGITINAVSGNVSIHGVSLDRDRITGIADGIVFNSAASASDHHGLCRTEFYLRPYITYSAELPVPVGFVISPEPQLIKQYFSIPYDVVNGSTTTAKAVIDNIIAPNNIDLKS